MKGRITERLMGWYATFRRELPWRTTQDPYAIWLSEVILQQTRVQQGLAYYERFIGRWPRVEQLAAASEDEVLKEWQGLGYYSRARNLHTAAKEIVNRFGGTFPADFANLRTLKGVGDYTAAAIASIAFNQPHAVVDGNVYRVLARLFDLATPIDSTEGKRTFTALAHELLDTTHPGSYNQAIMDFGAMQCTPQHPHCEQCPLQDCCLAYAAGTIAERPIKQGRTKIRDRYFHYLHLSNGTHTLLHRRKGGDIWQGLYEFPLIETDSACDTPTLVANPTFQQWLGGQSYQIEREQSMRPHQLSHQRLHATFFRIRVATLPAIEGTQPIAEERLGEYAVARLIDRYLELCARN